MIRSLILSHRLWLLPGWKLIPRGRPLTTLYMVVNFTHKLLWATLTMSILITDPTMPFLMSPLALMLISTVIIYPGSPRIMNSPFLIGRCVCSLLSWSRWIHTFLEQIGLSLYTTLFTSWSWWVLWLLWVGDCHILIGLYCLVMGYLFIVVRELARVGVCASCWAVIPLISAEHNWTVCFGSSGDWIWDCYVWNVFCVVTCTIW